MGADSFANESAPMARYTATFFFQRTVSRTAMHAMFDENPKRRYMVVPNQRQADIKIRKAIEEVVQLNQGQEYSYIKDELVKMLEESMAAHP